VDRLDKMGKHANIYALGKKAAHLNLWPGLVRHLGKQPLGLALAICSIAHLLWECKWQTSPGQPQNLHI
jgi:hypothetical protein